MLPYPLWTFGSELVSETLPTPVVDLVPQVAGLYVSNSIEIPLAVDVLLAYPEGHVFIMILP